MYDTPFFSLVLPTYNQIDYLPSAIECLRNQSYQDFEILIIDDGSTDGSGEYAESEAKNWGRIRVIHQPNAGLPSARNAGLTCALGDYILFLDPDDQYSPDLLSRIEQRIKGEKSKEEKMKERKSKGENEGNEKNEGRNGRDHEAGREDRGEEWDRCAAGSEEVQASEERVPDGAAGEDTGEPDVIIYGLEEVYIKGLKEYGRKRITPDESLDDKEIEEKVIRLEQQTLLGYAWNKAYKRSYLMERFIIFPDVPMIEDILFNVDVLRDKPKIAIIPEALYFYQIRDTMSLSRVYRSNYLELHELRLYSFLSLFDSWNSREEVMEKARNMAAVLYCRYFLAAMERNIGKMSPDDRVIWARSQMAHPFSKEMVSRARVESKALRAFADAMKKGQVRRMDILAEAASVSRKVAPGIFAKLKQERC